MESVIKEEELLISQIPIGAIFRHYKGKEYKIIQIGRHTEDLSLYIVYQGLYLCETYGQNPIWIRSLKAFLEELEIAGCLTKRFQLSTYP